MKDKYLQSGNANYLTPPDVLLDEMAKKLDEANLHTAHISYLFQSAAFTTNTFESLYAETLPLDKSDLELNNDNLALMMDEDYPRLSPEYHKTTHKEVSMLEIRNDEEPIEDWGDLSKLLRKAARELRKLNDIVVIDMIGHDYLNDDALHRPFIRIYYEKNAY